MLKVTEKASEKIKGLLKDKQENVVVRVVIKGLG